MVKLSPRLPEKTIVSVTVPLPLEETITVPIPEGAVMVTMPLLAVAHIFAVQHTVFALLAEATELARIVVVVSPAKATVSFLSGLTV